MATTRTLNDVNLEALGALVEGIRNSPDKARTSCHSTVTWQGGFRTEARSRDFEPVASDEPSTLGGTNSAPDPVEQLLGALGSCLVIGYAANASAAGIRLDNLKIELEGDLDLHTFLGLNEEGNAGFSTIRAKVDVETDASPAQVRELHRKVVASSPVGHSVARQVALIVELADGVT
jgi:uncharacterized OsmC-like protein